MLNSQTKFHDYDLMHQHPFEVIKTPEKENLKGCVEIQRDQIIAQVANRNS